MMLCEPEPATYSTSLTSRAMPAGAESSVPAGAPKVSTNCSAASQWNTGPAKLVT